MQDELSRYVICFEQEQWQVFVPGGDGRWISCTSEAEAQSLARVGEMYGKALAHREVADSEAFQLADELEPLANLCDRLEVRCLERRLRSRISYLRGEFMQWQ
jgi:hypothetical protein